MALQRRILTHRCPVVARLAGPVRAGGLRADEMAALGARFFGSDVAREPMRAFLSRRK